MKAKLVKYPFDEKKYRWDTWYQGKEFRYYWDESLPNNFETIEPYIETERKGTGNYGFISLDNSPTDKVYDDYEINVENKTAPKYLRSSFYIEPDVDITNYIKNERKIRFIYDAGYFQYNYFAYRVLPYQTYVMNGKTYELFTTLHFYYTLENNNLHIYITNKKTNKYYM